jgi:hypothetical protein
MVMVVNLRFHRDRKLPDQMNSYCFLRTLLDEISYFSTANTCKEITKQIQYFGTDVKSYCIQFSMLCHAISIKFFT